ncbi:MAG TPA: hypothetical protein VF403_03730, partial [Kofleriaceae bacterium]
MSSAGGSYRRTLCDQRDELGDRRALLREPVTQPFALVEHLKARLADRQTKRGILRAARADVLDLVATRHSRGSVGTVVPDRHRDMTVERAFELEALDDKRVDRRDRVDHPGEHAKLVAADARVGQQQFAPIAAQLPCTMFAALRIPRCMPAPPLAWRVECRTSRHDRTHHRTRRARHRRRGRSSH